MTINLKMPEIKELKPKITVFGVGGAGGNAVNNMIRSGLIGCEFVVANTDSQALTSSKAERLIQMGVAVTEGLGAGSQPEVGRAAAEEAIDEIIDHLNGSHMVFVTAGMGGGTGTGAAPIIARAARDQGILTVGVVTKPFQFEGARRMRVAEQGIMELAGLRRHPHRHPQPEPLPHRQREDHLRRRLRDGGPGALFGGRLHHRPDGQGRPDQSRLRRRPLRDARDGQGDDGDRRSLGRAARQCQAAEAAIANPLLDETSMKGAKGLLISITGGKDLTLFEVDEAATRIREEVDPDANIILGATFEESLEGVIRVSVVATGIDSEAREDSTPAEMRMAELSQRLRTATKPAPAARRDRTEGGSAASRGAGRRVRRAPQPKLAPPTQAQAAPTADQGVAAAAVGGGRAFARATRA